MSQKEKLIRQYFALKHKFDMNENCERPCPAEPTEKDIRSMQKEFKVMDLEYKINCVETALKNQAIRIEREKYFATEEGKLAKENAENEKANLWTQHKNLIIELENWLNKEIRYLLGNNWLCRANTGYHSVRVSIGMKNINPENSSGDYEFGHSFEITYDKDSFYESGVRFEMSYGCLGAFDLFKDTYRSEYREGQGKIANNKKLLKDLFDKIEDIENQDAELEKKMNKIENWLKNPTNNK